jgi:hypothetical protein
MGGLNLLNKAGHEALDNHKESVYGQGGNANVRGNYKVYEDEALNARISQPQIKGNCLLQPSTRFHAPSHCRTEL